MNNDKIITETDYPTINDWLDVTIGNTCDKIDDTLIQMTYENNESQRIKLRKICMGYLNDIYTIIGKKD